MKLIYAGLFLCLFSGAARAELLVRARVSADDGIPAEAKIIALYKREMAKPESPLCTALEPYANPTTGFLKPKMTDVVRISSGSSVSSQNARFLLPLRTAWKSQTSVSVYIAIHMHGRPEIEFLDFEHLAQIKIKPIK